MLKDYGTKEYDVYFLLLNSLEKNYVCIFVWRVRMDKWVWQNVFVFFLGLIWVEGIWEILFIYYLFRERVHASEGGWLEGEERENSKQAPYSAQCRAACGVPSHCHEIMTWAEARRWTLNPDRATQAPLWEIFILLL